MKGSGAKEAEKTARVRQLNDESRKSMSGGLVVLTEGSRASGFADEVVEAVKAFGDFTPDNDPYGEHDFGCVSIRGERFFWKVDYYDKELRFDSEDKADPSKTTRVLTIMRAEEY